MGAALAHSDRPLVLASGMLGLKDPGGRPPRTTGSYPAPKSGPTPPDVAPRLLCSRCPCGASGSVRPCCVFPRRFTAMATTGSWPPSSASPAKRVCPATWARAPTAGRRCTDPTPPAWRGLAVESAPAGSVLHAAGDEGVPFRQIAEAIGRHLGVPTASVSPLDAVEHFGHLGHFVALDSPATALITRELLGWEPTGPSLIEDLDQGHYFRAA